jgi:hypothetical protein
VAGPGAVAAALAPDELAAAVVLIPVDGLETCTLGCEVTLGLVDMEPEIVGLDGLTLTVVGAFTGGALPVDTGPTCADAGGTAATNSNRAIAPLNDLFVKRCMQHLHRAWLPQGVQVIRRLHARRRDKPRARRTCCVTPAAPVRRCTATRSYVDVTIGTASW